MEIYSLHRLSERELIALSHHRAQRRNLEAAAPRELPISLARAREALNAVLRRRLSAFGLSEQHWRILSVLADDERICVSELAARAALGIPSTSRILKELGRRGCVQVEASAAGEAGRKVASLAPGGLQIVALCQPFIDLLEARLRQALGTQRLLQLQSLLDEIEQRLDTDPDFIAQQGGKYV